MMASRARFLSKHSQGLRRGRATNEQTSLFEIWSQAAQAIGTKVIPEERGGLSDGNLLWQYLPVLDGLGPSGTNAHCSERSADGSKDQEYALLSSFVPKALLNITAILRLVELLSNVYSLAENLQGSTLIAFDLLAVPAGPLATSVYVILPACVGQSEYSPIRSAI